MAAELQLNGAGPSGSSEPSFAEQLQSKHANAHRMTVEDVEDEDDIQHLPPSTHLDGTVGVAESDPPLSEKAKGKQKVQESQGSAKAGISLLDMTSDEAFPALGKGSKPLAPPTSAPSTPNPWKDKDKKPMSMANGLANGKKGTNPPSSAGTSRASTPGPNTPMSPNFANPQARRMAGAVQLPGKYSENYRMRPSDLLPRGQMKKPVPDVVRDINKKSRATVHFQPAGDGGLDFEATGPSQQHVRQALRDISREIGARRSIKLPIPVGARPYIIGRQGATIKEIMRNSGADIQLPKADEVPADADDSYMVDVTILGDAISVALAESEVESIVDQKASNIDVRLRDIPPELYPFIAGPRNMHMDNLGRTHNVDIRVPHYYAWSGQPPPTVPPRGEAPNFMPHPTNHIVVSGNRRAVQDARAEIERQANILRSKLALRELEVSRGRHQFIAGDNGNSLHDVLRDTGCSFILPPSSEDTETITVCGPHDKLVAGEDHIQELASSLHSQNVDIGRRFQNPPMGATAYMTAFARYLQQRKMIEELEKMHNSRIVLPTQFDGSSPWEVFSREGRNTAKARTDILRLVDAHPPARFRHVELNPFYHQHLHAQHHDRMLQEQGVKMLLPDDTDDPKIMLVFEGPNVVHASSIPQEKPSQVEVTEFEKALLAAEKEILGIFADQPAIATRPVEVPPKFREKARKFVLRDQSELAAGDYPTSFFSHPPAADASVPSHNCFVKGPENNLEGLLKRIKAFVQQEEQDELERGFITSFDFPQKHAQHLIGKRGENINKLRDEFDVEIQVRDGKVEVKGPKAKAHEARERIRALAEQRENEVTYKLNVDSKFHKDLIGKEGEKVNRLQERYKLRIRFPRSPNNLDDVMSNDGSEPSTPRGHGPANEVVIMGPRDGANKAREEVLDLAKYLMDNSHAATISIAKEQLPSLIGTGGRNMENIRSTTGAQITVPAASEPADAHGRVALKIKGTAKQVDDAKKQLQQAVKTFDEKMVKDIQIDKQYHNALIGRGGATLRDIVLKAGGPDDRDHSRIVRFPRAGSNDDTIHIEGAAPMVEKIAAALTALAAQRASEVTESVEVAPDRHRQIIGAGGETRRKLEEQFKVKIDVPRQNVQGAARSQVKLVGAPADVAAAREHIQGMFAQPSGETVAVPRAQHHAVADNGAFFRRLRSEFGVTVDHAGQKPPPRPKNGGAGNGAPLPLITDGAATEPRWTLVDNAHSQGADGLEGTIPWVLKGKEPTHVEKAKAALLKALEGAGEPGVAGYLVLPGELPSHCLSFILPLSPIFLLSYSFSYTHTLLCTPTLTFNLCSRIYTRTFMYTYPLIRAPTIIYTTIRLLIETRHRSPTAPLGHRRRRGEDQLYPRRHRLPHQRPQEWVAGRGYRGSRRARRRGTGA